MFLFLSFRAQGGGRGGVCLGTGSAEDPSLGSVRVIMGVGAERRLDFYGYGPSSLGTAETGRRRRSSVFEARTAEHPWGLGRAVRRSGRRGASDVAINETLR